MTRLTTILSLVFLFLTSCGQDKNDYVVTIKTSKGDMIAILYDETPLHKENFIKLAKEHYFDSLLFHRVIQGFMIQGGDSASRHAQPGQPLGMGGKKYTIPAEINPKFFHEKGALSAARQSDNVNPKKASSGSQFYIVQGTVLTPADIQNMSYNGQAIMTGLRQMFEKPEYKPLLDSLNALYYAGDMQAYQKCIFDLAPRVEKVTGLKTTKDGITQEQKTVYSTLGGAPHLDGDYTVFGKVIKGFEVIDAIASVARDANERPTEDIRMIVTVEKMSKKKITKEYGYIYPVTKK